MKLQKCRSASIVRKLKLRSCYNYARRAIADNALSGEGLRLIGVTSCRVSDYNSAGTTSQRVGENDAVSRRRVATVTSRVKSYSSPLSRECRRTVRDRARNIRTERK